MLHIKNKQFYNIQYAFHTKFNLDDLVQVWFTVAIS